MRNNRRKGEKFFWEEKNIIVKKPLSVTLHKILNCHQRQKGITVNSFWRKKNFRNVREIFLGQVDLNV